MRVVTLVTDRGGGKEKREPGVESQRTERRTITAE